jgi:putative DNA primase/helicase
MNLNCFAIGMVGRKLPATMLSRSIFIEMRRRKADEPIEKFKHEDDNELADLRSRLLRWSMDNVEALRNVVPSMPDGFSNRCADNWCLQFAIADLAGADWGAKARAAALKIEGKSDSRTTSARALATTKLVLDAVEGDAISSDDLIQKMAADPDSEWAGWGKSGKPISQKQLANLLKRYGIVPEKARIDGRQVRGYVRAHFIEAWERWL